MNYQQLLKQLTDIGPRYAQCEMDAAKIIEDYLSSQNTIFTPQPFTSVVPIVSKAELIVDGKPVECLGSSIVSGQIPDGESHFGYSGETPYNIAYSPVTDSISVVDY